MTDTIINEPTSPALSSALSASRYVITAAGSYAIAKGWLDQSTVNAILALSAAVIPPAYGVYKAYRTSHALKAAAPFVSDKIIASK